VSFSKGSLGAAALYYASLGWAVFPLVPREKIPLLSKAKGGNGLKDASADVDTVTAWWTRYPDANIGLTTGASSGLVVVDVDGADGEAALAVYGELPLTVESTTGKGRHLLFRGSPEIRNSAGKLGPQLDVRAEGGYIVAPPSIHPNGGTYRWATGRHPGKLTPADLPESIAKRITGVVGSIQPVVGAAPQSAVDVVFSGVGSGGRNQALTAYAGRLFAKQHGADEVLELVRAVNTTKVNPPLEDAEVVALVQSIGQTHHRNHPPAPEPSQERQPSPLVPITVGIFEGMMEKAAKPVDAMPTMWSAWNRSCRMYGGGQGLARGWHVVAAGGAGAGKSLIALNMTAEALRNGHSVGWVSLEMSREQLLLRLLGIATGRKLKDLEPGASFDPGAFTAASYGFMDKLEVSGAHLWMAERPTRDLPSVNQLMQRAVDAGCRLIIVDYAQLVSVSGAKLDDAMRQVSAAVQSVAYQRDVNTLLLSQLNRSTTSDKGAPPTIFGLAGSSAIENDADQVLLIDQSAKTEDLYGKNFTVLLEKNRHGPSASIPVRMDTLNLQLLEQTPSAPKAAWYDRESA
jgi:KaiC/GvpD/RAD55 family RecA-like ATPase